MNNLSIQSKTIQVDIQPEEFFRDIQGFPGYQISNYGRVYSLKKNRIKSYTIKNNGYYDVELQSNNRRCHRYINRLVYEHFGDNPEKMKNKEVDHCDGNKSNNYIQNLRLATSSQNKANRGKISTYAGREPSSPFVGITWRRGDKKWRASIKVMDKAFHLGIFKHSKNGTYVYHEVCKRFKPLKFWKNNLPNNFQLPNEPEDRDVKIQEGINKINNWLNQQ